MEKINIFSKEDWQRVKRIEDSSQTKLSALKPDELADLIVIWCYYSAKIEGNSYTYTEAKALLEEGITPNKKYEDAKMLKNLYNTFVAEVTHISKLGKVVEIDERTLFRIHHSISSELVAVEESGLLRTRPVRINGTTYTPPADVIVIKEKLNEILFRQHFYEDPLERAIYLHCNLAKLQPFIDGNKRTARTLASIVLMNADFIPIHSSLNKDIINYRKGLLAFYESGDYTLYVDYFLSNMLRRVR